jgi:hypothetical protein
MLRAIPLMRLVQAGQVAVLVSRLMRQPALLALAQQPEKVWPVNVVSARGS